MVSKFDRDMPLTFKQMLYILSLMFAPFIFLGIVMILGGDVF